MLRALSAYYAHMPLLLIPLWFLALSVLSFVLMALDKRAAQNGGWRFAERTLLLWAFLGGGVGAKLAQNRLRHKTRKEPFGTLLNISFGANLVLMICLAIPEARGALSTLVEQAF